MCLYPLTMYRYVSSETGEVIRSFKRVPESALGYEKLSLPCGKCVECLASYSSEWANRCMLEASLHERSCMITLTYKDSDCSVHRSDLQLFLKRLRKAVYPTLIRFFACGEYGKKGKRPHYHVIIFGWSPSDLVEFFMRDSHWVYKSDFVAKVWQSPKAWSDLPRSGGFISVERLVSQVAKYTAKYMQKLNSLPEGVEKPFTSMSLKPGIGLLAFKDSWRYSDHIYLNGLALPVPRYFRRKLGFEGDVLSRKLRGELLRSSLKARRSEAKMRLGRIRV